MKSRNYNNKDSYSAMFNLFKKKGGYWKFKKTVFIFKKVLMVNVQLLNYILFVVIRLKKKQLFC
jgi:hypothetical protein